MSMKESVNIMVNFKVGEQLSRLKNWSVRSGYPENVIT